MKITWKNCIRIGITLFVVFLVITKISSIKGYCIDLWHAVFPLILGGVIAYAVNIPMSFYEKKLFCRLKPTNRLLKFKRPICLTAAIITLILVVSVVSALVIPKLVSCVRLMIAVLPSAFEQVEEFIISNKMLSSLLTEDFLNTLSSIDWNSFITNSINLVTKSVGNLAGTVSKAAVSVFSGVATFFMSFIFAVYLLSCKETLARQFNSLTNKLIRRDINTRSKKVISVLNESFHNFIVGQCIEACILGGLCVLGMWIFRFEYSMMIGTLIGFTALIPIAGAYIGAGIGALILLTVSPTSALLFLIFVIILQQLEGNIIYPRVVGASVGLPGIWTFAAVVVGGGLFGVAGMLIGVPLTASAYKLIRHHVKKTARKNSSS